MNLTGRLIQVTDVTARERDQMFSLMDAYYENLDRSTFDAHLEEKHWVILLQGPISRVVRGFSTQMLMSLEIQQRPVRALFSGDTIVDRDYWAHNPLAQIWGRFALSLIDDDFAMPLYWFLITKGYKTYRFLPVFFNEFYPRYESLTPAWASEVTDALARTKYPAEYESRSGTIRSVGSACRLRDGVAEIETRRLTDPHIRFFAERNPGHARGDELCCLAPLTRENFTPAAYRVIGPTAVFSGVTG